MAATGRGPERRWAHKTASKSDRQPGGRNGTREAQRSVRATQQQAPSQHTAPDEGRVVATQLQTQLEAAATQVDGDDAGGTQIEAPPPPAAEEDDDAVSVATAGSMLELRKAGDDSDDEERPRRKEPPPKKEPLPWSESEDDGPGDLVPDSSDTEADQKPRREPADLNVHEDHAKIPSCHCRRR